MENINKFYQDDNYALKIHKIIPDMVCVFANAYYNREDVFRYLVTSTVFFEKN